jgi:hypothetical protein
MTTRPPSESDGDSSDTTATIVSLLTTYRSIPLALLLVSLFAVEPALAQSSSEAFCETKLVETAKNVFTIIQFGGPLIGGVIALGSAVAMPTMRRSDVKREIKQMRNQAVIWGVIVAPLGTTIIGFLLTHVVAGGSSCTF